MLLHLATQQRRPTQSPQCLHSVLLVQLMSSGEPMPFPEALTNVLNRGHQSAQAATACTTAAAATSGDMPLLLWTRRTVFITGFPNDVKERELNNMLRFMPGYEASQMNWKNGQVSSRGGTHPSTIALRPCACTLVAAGHTAAPCFARVLSLAHASSPCTVVRHKASHCSTLELLRAPHALP